MCAENKHNLCFSVSLSLTPVVYLRCSNCAVQGCPGTHFYLATLPEALQTSECCVPSISPLPLVCVALGMKPWAPSSWAGTPSLSYFSKAGFLTLFTFSSTLLPGEIHLLTKILTWCLILIVNLCRVRTWRQSVRPFMSSPIEEEDSPRPREHLSCDEWMKALEWIKRMKRKWTKHQHFPLRYLTRNVMWPAVLSLCCDNLVALVIMPSPPWLIKCQTQYVS